MKYKYMLNSRNVLRITSSLAFQKGKTEDTTPEKRGRGRPKGAKNKNPKVSLLSTQGMLSCDSHLINR